jgi:amphi-Trp domain-containing protein
MSDMKFKKQENVTRDEAALRLMEIATALGRGEKFELVSGGERIRLDVPDWISLELKVDMEDGETELEVELKWGPPPTPAADSGPESSQRT